MPVEGRSPSSTVTRSSAPTSARRGTEAGASSDPLITLGAGRAQLAVHDAGVEGPRPLGLVEITGRHVDEDRNCRLVVLCAWIGDAGGATGGGGLQLVYGIELEHCRSERSPLRATLPSSDSMPVSIGRRYCLARTNLDRSGTACVALRGAATAGKVEAAVPPTPGVGFAVAVTSSHHRIRCLGQRLVRIDPIEAPCSSTTPTMRHAKANGNGQLSSHYRMFGRAETGHSLGRSCARCLRETDSETPLLVDPPASPARVRRRRRWGLARTLPGSSSRAGDVLALIAQGLSNDDIAGRAFLSVNTIRTRVSSNYQKTGADSRTQAMLRAVGNSFRPDILRIVDPALVLRPKSRGDHRRSNRDW